MARPRKESWVVVVRLRGGRPCHCDVYGPFRLSSTAEAKAASLSRRCAGNPDVAVTVEALRQP